MAHPLDALALVALGNVGADEGEGHGVEPALQHRLHVVDQLARNRVLVGGDPEAQLGHGPFDRRPVQGREAGADPERALAQAAARGREDGGARIVLLDQILQPQQVREGRRKIGLARRSRHPVGEHPGSPWPPRRPPISSRSRPSPDPRTATTCRPPSRIGCAGTGSGAPRRVPVALAAKPGQSRQKSGLTHGLVAIRRSFWCRNELIVGIGGSGKGRAARTAPRREAETGPAGGPAAGYQDWAVSEISCWRMGKRSSP